MQTSTQKLTSVLQYCIVGVFLLLFLASAVLGPDFLAYLQWAEVFQQLDTGVFLSLGHTLSPMGVPLTQWSHGPGLMFSLCPPVCDAFIPWVTQVLLIGFAFAVVLWLAMFRLVRHAAHGDVQWAIYGILIAITGTHLGFYSRSYGSETFSFAFLAVMILWVITRKKWRVLDLLVVGCLAGLLVIIRSQFLIYSLPLFGLMYYHIGTTRETRSRLLTVSLLAIPVIPLFVALAQVALTNRWMTGNFLGSPYSFGNAAFRSLDFLHPEFLAVLFHPWHGLISHHPVYLLGFIALMVLTFQSSSTSERIFYFGYALAILAHLYLQAAWYVWWLGTQTFGMRGMGVSAVVLVPVLIRFMRERELHNKSNTLFGILVLAACVWSTPLFLANLHSETQFMTYSELFASYKDIVILLQPALLILVGTFLVVFFILRLLENKIVRSLRENIVIQLHARPTLLTSSIILFPMGVYCLIEYVISKYSQQSAVSSQSSIHFALISIPVSVAIILLFFGTSDSNRSTTLSQSQTSSGSEFHLRTNTSYGLNSNTIIAYGLIILFVLTSADFARLAIRVETQIATGHVPTTQAKYISPVRVDEVEDSYCEYLNVPGFEAKKAALKAYLEDLKACAAIKPATEMLPQCLSSPKVDFSLGTSVGSDLALDKVTLAGGAEPDTPTTFRAGDLVGITTSWRMLNATKPVKFSQRLVDTNGRQWFAADYLPEVYCETAERWQRSETYADHRSILLPPDLPPGQYEVILVVYDPETGDALPAGGKLSTRLVAIDVAAADTPPQPSSLSIPVRLTEALGEEIQLLGYGVEPEPLHPESGGTLNVWWNALRHPTQPYQIQIELVDPTGQAISKLSQPLSYAPADTWQKGQVVRERYPLVLDRGAVAGNYRLRLSLLAPDGSAIVRPLDMGSVSVQSRPRTYDLPPIDHPLNMKLGQNIMLRGYSWSRPAGADNSELQVTLYWQALDSGAGQYKVFVHVVDDSGHVVAQHDEFPAAGTAPTESWLPGEVVVDTHLLNVPSGGPYRLVTGLYDPSNGQRLPVWDEAQQPVRDSEVPLEDVKLH